MSKATVAPGTQGLAVATGLVEVASAAATAAARAAGGVDVSSYFHDQGWLGPVQLLQQK